MIVTIFIFIVVLGLLVFVHEFGHFIVAKKSGMKVDEFGFGFPPRLIGLQKVDGRWRVIVGHRDASTPATSPQPSPKSSFAEATADRSEREQNTIYSINLIPLGGFVKIVGENNDHEDDPRSFINKPFWPRFFTLAAGVIMNVLLAFALTSGGLMYGLPTAIDSASNLPKGANIRDVKIAILEVVPNQPAGLAGLKPGDEVLSVDNNIFINSEETRNYIKANPGNEFVFSIRRKIENSKTAELEIKVKSIASPAEGQGPTGIVLAEIGIVRLPAQRAIIEGARSTYYQLSNIIGGLYSLFTQPGGFAALGGPVKIAKLTGEVANMGFGYLIQFTAFLSLNLAILNILPFPALDGGRILFLIIEKIRGKRNNQRLEQILNTAGFMLLILLMIAVTIKDVKGF